jgi:hypothetical protein
LIGNSYLAPSIKMDASPVPDIVRFSATLMKKLL